jgi:hypothetical protein
MGTSAVDPVQSFVQSFFLMNLTSFHLVMNQQAKLCAAAL